METAAQWLAGYDERLAKAAADAKAANESLRQMSGTAASPRGEITVQVGPSGAMEDIRLTPAARAMEAEQLAQLILTTSQEAQRTVGAQVVEIMTEYVGDGPALDFVKENMPPAAGVEAGARHPAGDDDDDFFANPVVIV
ncbi:YbaB/EbfC DNA-binding family protein [Saccharopolyspora antimicrobica]|uniref:YbaB/EbfC DNA-binding family protein n=1 Tax=Saccharopolyspora antimicrobica TaxID=455193 RepID=A0A1I4TUA4_9PSEU|nr:YbaB/EbfC family nucleoid-associated protein [Saccharopolyspora antimicrobica]RKT88561.1 YbaB/EbfC DNA-binding family protein [Saccharopolyspora antimicrobica]SFM80346.1 YbaB/EbfC DNA-binding family protein [Saccharopolyspora antimicrobica]